MEEKSEKVCGISRLENFENKSQSLTCYIVKPPKTGPPFKLYIDQLNKLR